MGPLITGHGLILKKFNISEDYPNFLFRGDNMDFNPAVVTLELTNACNLRCKHCYGNAGEYLENELEYEEIKKILKDLHDAGTMEIELSGGEPLLRHDFIKILEAAQFFDFGIKIISNGTLINKKIAKDLSNFAIDHVQLSLEGLNESHEYLRGNGTFGSTITAINALRDEGMNVALRTTATKKSLDDVNGIVELAVELGAYKFGVVRFFPAGRGMSYKDELMLNANDMLHLHEIIKDIYRNYADKIDITADPCGFFSQEISDKFKRESTTMCPCGKTWCLIRPNGIVSPCEIMTIYAGNVRKQNFQEIWESSPAFKLFREFRPEFLKGTCNSCHHKDVCGGYCRALAILYTGDMYAEDFTCYHVLNKNK